jgi:hypothetical protein
MDKKHYRYDSEHDSYYRVYSKEELREHTRDTLWIVGITAMVMVIGILYEIFVK